MTSHKVLENALVDLIDELNSTGAYDFVPKALQVVVAIEDTPNAKGLLEKRAQYVETVTVADMPYSYARERMLQQLQAVTPNPPKLADRTGRTLDDPLDDLLAMPEQQTEVCGVEDTIQTIDRLCSDYKLSTSQKDAVNEFRRQVAEVESRAKNFRVDDCQWVQQMCTEGTGGEAFAFLELESANYENVSEGKLFAGRLVSVVELILDEIKSQGKPDAQPATENDESTTEEALDADFALRFDAEIVHIKGFGESGSFPKITGFDQLAKLLQKPHTGVQFLELMNVDDKRIKADNQREQALGDTQAKNELRDRVRAAQADLEKAKMEGNTVEEDHCRKEIESVAATLRRMEGVAGKKGEDLNSKLDRCRKSIHGTLKAVRNKLKDAGLNELEAHLESTISASQGEFLYRPPQNLAPIWVISK